MTFFRKPPAPHPAVERRAMSSADGARRWNLAAPEEWKRVADGARGPGEEWWEKLIRLHGGKLTVSAALAAIAGYFHVNAGKLDEAVRSGRESLAALANLPVPVSREAAAAVRQGAEAAAFQHDVALLCVVLAVLVWFVEPAIRWIKRV